MKLKLSIASVCLFWILISCTSDKPQQVKTFTNPILAGFYPDPSVCRVGSDYYLVNSTFAYYPGIPVFHSKDLVNWEQIGYVMDRPEQLELEGHRVSRGIFAPAIRYHDGLFYVTCTVVGGKENFVVTANNPAGPWSDPFWLPEVIGIDPSMFFDGDKGYIVYNSVAPDNNPLYDGHRTIRMYEMNLDSLQVMGKEHILINGGTDIAKKPIWIEGPHIYKIDNYYYLMAAEGGTAENHSEVIFRSSSIIGPYESYKGNPILTQRHLDPNRSNAITSTGHADLVQTEKGDWWAVFLGCRAYDSKYYNTGRETFLAPVKWIDGWPVINPDHEEIQYTYPVPVDLEKNTSEQYSGNFKFHDDFSSDQLSLRYSFLRTVREKWYNLTSTDGFLTMKIRPETCSGKANPSFIGHRQQHLIGEASTALTFTPTVENEKAGMLIFQNEKHFYFLCKSIQSDTTVVQLYKSTDSDSIFNMERIASANLSDKNTSLQLKIKAQTDTYSFYYAVDGGEWNSLLENADGKFLSTQVAGGFVGSFFAMYATSHGEKSDNEVLFDWFDYQGDDNMYKVE